MLFAFFGLGLGEVIVLGLICFVPLVAVAIIVPVVILASKRSSKPKDPNETHDTGGEG